MFLKTLLWYCCYWLKRGFLKKLKTTLLVYPQLTAEMPDMIKKNGSAGHDKKILQWHITVEIITKLNFIVKIFNIEVLYLTAMIFVKIWFKFVNIRMSIIETKMLPKNYSNPQKCHSTIFNLSMLSSEDTERIVQNGHGNSTEIRCFTRIPWFHGHVPYFSRLAFQMLKIDFHYALIYMVLRRYITIFLHP